MDIHNNTNNLADRNEPIRSNSNTQRMENRANLDDNVNSFYVIYDNPALQKSKNIRCRVVDPIGLLDYIRHFNENKRKLHKD